MSLSGPDLPCSAAAELEAGSAIVLRLDESERSCWHDSTTGLVQAHLRIGMNYRAFVPVAGFLGRSRRQADRQLHLASVNGMCSHVWTCETGRSRMRWGSRPTACATTSCARWDARAYTFGRMAWRRRFVARVQRFCCALCERTRYTCLHCGRSTGRVDPLRRPPTRTWEDSDDACSGPVKTAPSHAGQCG